MRLVGPPTPAGEDQWPVPSAIRVNTADDPAELVVLVDYGESTPQPPYATLQAAVTSPAAYPIRCPITAGNIDKGVTNAYLCREK